MLEWYKDDELAIYFSREPDVEMRYIHPYETEDEKQKIKTKPFLNKEKIDVVLVDWLQPETYNFTIPANYTWDGASIPRAFWRLIGSKTDNRFLIPSLIHDVLTENHNYVDNDRYFSTRVFERLLYTSGVPAFSRWMMFHCVDNYQKFCRWER